MYTRLSYIDMHLCLCLLCKVEHVYLHSRCWSKNHNFFFKNLGTICVEIQWYASLPSPLELFLIRTLFQNFKNWQAHDTRALLLVLFLECYDTWVRI